jgi:DNA modification methylase
MIKQQDSLAFLKEQQDLSVDINYSDPPYALGSEIIIRPDGKVDYKNASDFMNKWEMPTGDWWEQWFKEAFRTTKHGGYVIMFGMDRQPLLFKYYAHLAGFTEKQSMYWYFISNFPKATDLSKMIDKNAGAERCVVGKYVAPDGKERGGVPNILMDVANYQTGDRSPANITAPSTPLAQKYSGYKYSIAPLKQTNETIMIFQKPYKTKSCLHDTLAFENGDESISVGAMDIDGNRVGLNGEKQPTGSGDRTSWRERENRSDRQDWYASKTSEAGRYPSQTLCDTGASEVLDRQSGVKKGSKSERSNNIDPDNTYNGGWDKFTSQNNAWGDTGGCSKILHKCDFEAQEHDLYIYQPKVSKKERNAGCEEMGDVYNPHSSYGTQTEEGIKARGRNPENQNQPVKNHHPTLKPIALNEKVLKLFKTPNDQRIIYPFGGAGSEIIGGIKAGFDNWSACELSPEYVEIAKARIEYWTTLEENEPKQAVLV